MSEDLQISEITHVVELSSNRVYGHCKLCQSAIRQGNDLLDMEINHYIEKHGYRLIHVGTQSQVDRLGRLISVTVALMGRPKE